jgi:hypothetical protein
MLSPDEWKQLHASAKATKREVNRLSWGKNRDAEQNARAELKRIQETIAAYNDGSDPWAPMGGMDTSLPGYGMMALWRAWDAVRRSHKRRERSLYFSLAANALLCFGAGGALRCPGDLIVLYLGYGRAVQHEMNTIEFYANSGGMALALAATIVLQRERRAARRAFRAAQRVQNAAPQQAGVAPAVERRRVDVAPEPTVAFMPLGRR